MLATLMDRVGKERGGGVVLSETYTRGLGGKSRCVGTDQVPEPVR